MSAGRPPRLPLSKTCNPADFGLLRDELAAVDAVGIAGQHPMRRWEYAMALYTMSAWAAAQIPVPRFHQELLLDVGGGGSPFTQILTHAYDEQFLPAIIDPTLNHGIEASPLGDACAAIVTCISVLEHVEHPTSFLRACARHLRPGGLLFLTVDYWDCEGPDTAHFHWMRQRIYNRPALTDVLTLVRGFGLRRFGGTDWTYHGNQVFDYSFCSLALRKDGPA